MSSPRLATLFVIAASLASIVVSSTPVGEQYFSGSSCDPVDVGENSTEIICVCKGDSCPEFKFRWPRHHGDLIVITSTKQGKRFFIEDLKLNDSSPDELEIQISIDLDSELQPVLGWGGAITDAATLVHDYLQDPLKTKLVESYYGPGGLQYNFGRVPLGGSDFSIRPYTYDDSAKNDLNLNHWSLQYEDIHHKIPFIKSAKKLVEETGSELKLFSSPWSPPKWMKSNNNIVRGFLKDDEEIYKSYANYIMKFYGAYEKEGIKFWGATVQNEPVSAESPSYFFNSLQMHPKQMKKFIGTYLGPALSAKNYTRHNFNLMIGDDNLGFVNHFVPEVMADPAVSKYITGLAFHWYNRKTRPYKDLTKLQRQLGDKISFTMMSEACNQVNNVTNKLNLGSWANAEEYALDIINDFVRGTGAWIDWNFALNMQGGPNWSENYNDSPIIVNPDDQEFYKQPMYFVLGHFSRFFRPGSVVVQSHVAKSSGYGDVHVLSAKNKKTGHLVMTMVNTSDKDRKVRVTLNGSGGRDLIRILEPRSITSVAMKL